MMLNDDYCCCRLSFLWWWWLKWVNVLFWLPFPSYQSPFWLSPFCPSLPLVFLPFFILPSVRYPVLGDLNMDVKLLSIFCHLKTFCRGSCCKPIPWWLLTIHEESEKAKLLTLLRQQRWCRVCFSAVPSWVWTWSCWRHPPAHDPSALSVWNTAQHQSRDQIRPDEIRKANKKRVFMRHSYHGRID